MTTYNRYNTYSWRNLCMNVHSIIYNQKGGKQPKCPSTDKWMNKMWYVHTRLEKAMAPHSSTLAWKIPWTEEPGGLQSMGSLRVGCDWATSLSLFTFMHWRRKWQSTPVFLPGESQGRGAWWAAVYGVAQSRTWLKRLSSSSTHTVLFKIKRNKVLIHTTTCMNCENITLKKPITNCISLYNTVYEIPRTGKIIKTQSRLVID